MSDEQAAASFHAIRWASTNGEPVCPNCGSLEQFDLEGRPVWKCKGCNERFSLTSGTIFQGRKLSLCDILGATAMFTNGAKRVSALQLSRDRAISFNSAYVHCIKARVVKMARDEGVLSGDVEVDGAYLGGYVKPASKSEDRKDLRKKIHQTGKRQVVIAARERGGGLVTAVADNEAEGVAVARTNIAAGSTVHADEASHWDKLAARFPIKRVNHKKAPRPTPIRLDRLSHAFAASRLARIIISLAST